MSLATLVGPIKLITFDGDVTLYDDGQCLVPTNPVIEKILWLMEKGLCIGIVTAAGYTDGARYKDRLYGLLEQIRDSNKLTDAQKLNLVVLGGESSYMFRCLLHLYGSLLCQLIAVLDLLPSTKIFLNQSLEWTGSSKKW